ncbi:MAG: GFA family protein [Pseudomonadota bacterium]
MAVEGVCHCGAVSYRVNAEPAQATVCNCSICRRLGAVWIYAPGSDVAIDAAPDATLRYTHGEANIAFHTCRTCGATTHWENLREGPSARMAVNLSLADPKVAASIPVRHFDGADTWTFL